MEYMPQEASPPSSNQPLSRAETLAIHAKIRRARAYIQLQATKYARIAKEQEADGSDADDLDDHGENVWEVMDYIAQEERALRPILSLPPELLSSIFQHHDDEIQRYAGEWPRERTSPRAGLLVSSVCRFWRSCATEDTPSLWTTAGVHFEAQRQNSPEAQALWLSRSGALPLRIYISGIGRTTGTTSMMKTLSILVAHSARWGLLEVTTPDWVFQHMGDIQHRLPMLKRLEFGYNDDDQTLATTLFEDCPLDTLFLGVYTPSEFNAPWGSLSKLTLSRVSFADVAIPLAQTGQLRELEIELVHHSAIPVAPLCVEQLQKLTLTVGLEKTRHLHELFDKLIAPSLRELKISRVMTMEGFWPYTQFASFLQRTALVVLNLNGWLLEHSDFVACLRAVPHLESLYLANSEPDGGPISTEVVSALRVTTGKDVVVPRLASLKLRGPMDLLDERTLVDVLLSRTREKRGHSDDGKVSKDGAACLQRINCSFQRQEKRPVSTALLIELQSRLTTWGRTLEIYFEQ